jgi:hypothetical protein
MGQHDYKGENFLLFIASDLQSSFKTTNLTSALAQNAFTRSDHFKNSRLVRLFL